MFKTQEKVLLFHERVSSVHKWVMLFYFENYRDERTKQKKNLVFYFTKEDYEKFCY